MTVDSPAARVKLIGEEEVGLLLEEIQLSFWIDFTPEDVIAAQTVGDLFAFFRLRRSLVELAGLDRRSILPKTRLRNLLPPPMRRAWWDAIETGLRFRLPRLRPGPAAKAVYSAIAALGLFAFVIAPKSVSWETMVLIDLGAPVLIWALVKAASRLPREFPTDTFEDLVRSVVVLNQQKLSQEAGGCTVNQAWGRFERSLVAPPGSKPLQLPPTCVSLRV